LHNKGPQDWGYDNYYYIILYYIIDNYCVKLIRHDLRSSKQKRVL